MNKTSSCKSCGSRYTLITSYPQVCKNGDIVHVPKKPSQYCPACNGKRSEGRRNQLARLDKYGLSEFSFAKLLVLQGGKCAICQEPMPTSCIDHDHITGQVRGLLCDSCNTGLGLFRDNPAFLIAAAQYLKEPPMSLVS